jgi:hypothetical protein
VDTVAKDVSVSESIVWMELLKCDDQQPTWRLKEELEIVVHMLSRGLDRSDVVVVVLVAVAVAVAVERYWRSESMDQDGNRCHTFLEVEVACVRDLVEGHSNLEEAVVVVDILDASSEVVELVVVVEKAHR